ncbi:hypothetical protein Daura_49970 [Dactylosporangium aurantiacum]|uniref:Uncharacterized protein n=1 Tax=Dactylosporangium aurantiacum TaxID=35754 RepID=A0A9Q9MM69_9ACTN|nr:hypothetical protein [Dactylosporangium aurantiacum]MDG6107396.1 hypothetical protein [Dactylosporangium aurantiacum]UWZ54477.1 hypothetical protein Daura_49970 [Dactylosporangium aurantiacum]
MNTYDDLVNDYLRAVEQALDGVPASRRDELLADLSDHIAAKLAETRAVASPAPPEVAEAEVRSVLDLLGDPADVAADLEAGAFDPPPADPPPIEITAGRKVGALIWVLITASTVSLLCVGVVLAAAFLFFTGR